MASVIVMPKLSPTMEEGVLVKWTKREGDKVAPGDVIAEVETDKANMDFPLEDEGVLLRLLVKEGETVKLGAPVAVLGEAGEDADAALQAEGAGAAGAAAPTVEKAPAPAAAETAKVTGERPATATAATGDDVGEGGTEPSGAQAKGGPPAPTAAGAPAAPATGAPPAKRTEAAAPVDAGGGERRIKASPLARKIAADEGVDLRSVPGSGPSGRIVKRDVEAAARAPAPAPAAATAPSVAARAPGPPAAGDETLPLSQMRKTIARRLVTAKQTVPHFYLTMDVRADALAAFHEQLRAVARAPGDELKISVNDLVIKAVAVGLGRIPEANASFGDDAIVRHGRIDIGVAVALDDGLITPVVRGADHKSVGTIAREVRELAARARTKKLRPDEYTGATFTISNLGMFGVREFSAIINPPESGVLAVGALEKRAVAVARPDGSDALAVERRMTLTLSCDHRVVDGALGARLLRAIVDALEQPLSLVL